MASWLRGKLNFFSNYYSTAINSMIKIMKFPFLRLQNERDKVQNYDELISNALRQRRHRQRWQVDELSCEALKQMREEINLWQDFDWFRDLSLRVNKTLIFQLHRDWSVDEEEERYVDGEGELRCNAALWRLYCARSRYGNIKLASQSCVLDPAIQSNVVAAR